MAFSKTYLFSDDEQEISRSGRILGHPARVRILRMLVDNGPMQFGALLQALPLNQGTVTSHVQKLRRYGLLDVEEQGLTTIYAVNMERLRALLEVQRSLAVDLCRIFSLNSDGPGDTRLTA